MAWFFNTRMAATNNALEGAKFHEQKRKEAEEDGEHDKAKRHARDRELGFDTCDKHLRSARQETEEAIRERNAQNPNIPDPSERRGWFW